MPDSGRASDAGPRAHVHCDFPDASGRSGDRFLEGKTAIAMARLCGKEWTFTGEQFWARGYGVSTVGFELEKVRCYMREQKEADGLSGEF